MLVNGKNEGKMGKITRLATAGDYPAPMVTNALMTADDAVRQRGLAELAKGGRRALVRISLPVIPADNLGPVYPGELIDWGGGRRGLARGLSITGKFPTVRQLVEIEMESLE